MTAPLAGNGWADAGVRAAVRSLLPVALAGALPEARWYGDKGRPTAGIDVVDLAAGVDGFAFAIAAVRFADGDEARYLVPLALVPADPEPAGRLLRLPGEPAAVADALAAPDFGRWLLGLLREGAVLRGDDGSFVFSRLPGDDALARAADAPARVGTAEQSNSSVRYGDVAIVKLFRKLRPGLNPDVEIGRYLMERSSFRHFPAPLAVGDYLAGRGEPTAIAFAQAFVPSVGDGWAWTLGELDRLVAGEVDPGSGAAVAARYDAAVRLLGRRTGDLHLALAAGSDGPAFAPEPIGDDRVTRWESDLRTRLRETLVDLARADLRATGELGGMLPTLSAAAERLAERASGFVAQRGGAAIRVHGDFHLGQTLRTAPPEDDWVLLDFEGEPARPLAERRAKTSALKDVAGMLRSFAYARGAALRSLAAPTDEQRRVLEEWERRARAAFLAGYRDAVVVSPVPIVPTDGAAFRRALDAWELDKAVYEVAYELRNRPDWLAIPVGALLAGATDG